MRRSFLSVFCLAIAVTASTAFGGDVQVPLFVIERNVNGNVVHYDARLKDGKLDPQQPVVAYWVMGADGHRQELNLLERLKAYGFSIFPDKQSEVFRMTLVSDKKKEIRVFKTGDVVRAAARIGTCEAYLQKIFIESKKSWMVNLPEYAEMIGNDISTGAECRERVTPGDR
ncbi:MAG: DUF4833 domain-containing protein [Acidobacteriota bacterium]